MLTTTQKRAALALVVQGQLWPAGGPAYLRVHGARFSAATLDALVTAGVARKSGRAFGGYVPAEDVHAWADGYGQWHAVVPLVLTGAEGYAAVRRAQVIAARVIAEELAQRGELRPGYRVCVTRSMDRPSIDGAPHFVEV